MTGTESGDVRGAPPALDTTRRYVRVTRDNHMGFIEFDFAIGEEDLFVELILSPDAFQRFLAETGAALLPPREAAPSPSEEAAEWDWRLAEARDTRFK
jgi:phenol hydroxylase P0 protein